MVTPASPDLQPCPPPLHEQPPLRPFLATHWRRNVTIANYVDQNLRGSNLDAEDLAACLQQGILRLFSHSADMINSNIDRKATFEYAGGPCEMTELLTEAFQEVRSAFGVNENDYTLVLSGKRSDGKCCDFRLISADSGNGRSLSWLLLSGEASFFLKTCSSSEVHVLFNILDSYLEHVQTHNDTLLPQYYSAFHIKRNHLETACLLMSNVFPSGIEIARRFDLKGSTHGRSASSQERTKGSRATLKDLDLLRIGKPFVLSGGDLERMGLLSIIDQDCKWLTAQGLIDYSLLVALVRCDADDLPSSCSHAVKVLPIVPPQDSGELKEAKLIFLGLCDILTFYGTLKRMEYLFFACVLGDISCQPPAQYASRFCNFLCHAFRETDSNSNEFERSWLRQAKRANRRYALSVAITLFAIVLYAIHHLQHAAMAQNGRGLAFLRR